MKIDATKTDYFICELENGEYYPLTIQYQGTGFQRTPEIKNAHRFKTESEAKQACTVQSMMNSMFGKTAEVFFFRIDETRTKFDKDGTESEI